MCSGAAGHWPDLLDHFGHSGIKNMIQLLFNYKYSSQVICKTGGPQQHLSKGQNVSKQTLWGPDFQKEKEKKA